MKKKIAIICFVAMIVLVGCEPADSEWDISENYWEIWGQGSIVEIDSIDISGTQRDGIEYTFDNGRVVEMGHIKDPGTIQVGSTGTLYKFTMYNAEDLDGWFQWKPDTSQKRITEKAIQIPVVKPTHPTTHEYVETTVVKVAPVNHYEWERVLSGYPDFNTTVLVKLKNDIVTTAYYTRDKEWKTEIDRTKSSKGRPLQDVVQWKLVDLE